MKKTMLVAPFEGPLASAVAAEARAAGWAVALALPGQGAAKAAGREPSPVTSPERPPAPDGDTVALPYNPASFVSVSALVLAARNALGELDALVLVEDASSSRPDFALARPGELGALVEGRCSGPLYLAREAARRFEARKSGRILLLSARPPRDAALGPPAALVDGAFEGLGRGLFAAAAGAPWSAYGVQDASGLPERAARFAVGLLAEGRGSKAGKWLRFTGKTGIFGL